MYSQEDETQWTFFKCLYGCVCFSHIWMCIHGWCPWKSEVGVGSFGIKGNRHVWTTTWVLGTSLGPQSEDQMLLSASLVSPSGFLVFVWLVFRDTFSLCSPSCPRTYFVDQGGLEIKDLLTSASWTLGLKVCTTTAPVFLLLKLVLCLYLWRSLDNLLVWLS